jgi:hypothetical protein
MMITVNVVGEFLTGSYNGKPFGVKFTEQKYAQMKELEAKAASVQSMEELKPLLEDFELLTKEDYKELVEHAKGGQYLWVNPYTGKIFLKINNKVSSIALPKALVDRIITSVEKKIDVMPLVKCWARFIRPVVGRPSYSAERGSMFAQYIDADYTNQTIAEQFKKEKGYSDEIAKAVATTKQVAITQEGLLACYKVSKEIRHRYELNDDEEVVQKSRYTPQVDPDTGLVTYAEPQFAEERLFEPYVMGKGGDEFFCGDKAGHFIRVGQVHYLDSWDKVGNPGYKGLHVGGLRYIAGYQQEGTVTHEVFVDPMHIYGIAGLGNGNDGAMTTKQYFVHRSFVGPNKSIYHSSEYAKKTDTEYAELIKAAVEQAQQDVDKITADLDEKKNLL